MPSLKSLKLEMRVGEQLLSTGTGFVVQSRRGPSLITNRHNVTGRHQLTGKPLSPTSALPSAVTIRHNRKAKLGEWVHRTEALFVGSTPRWYEHPAFGAKADVVALPLSELDDVDVYPYDVVNTGPAVRYGPADPVSVVGFPFGLDSAGGLPIWATGFVASEPTVDYDSLPIFLIDCRSRPGQSGSAVIAFRSGGMVATEGEMAASVFDGPVTRFLGIYSGRIHDQSDIGMVWKASAVRALAESVG